MQIDFQKSPTEKNENVFIDNLKDVFYNPDAEKYVYLIEKGRESEYSN